MTVNRNIGEVIPETNGVNRIGSDNPGQTSCSLCKKTVQPRPILGKPNKADQKAMVNETSAGYVCPSCGHNLNRQDLTPIIGKVSEVLVTSAGNATTIIVDNGTLQLTARVSRAAHLSGDVDWTSSAPGVATVSATGLVTAITNGSAVITATSKADKTKKHQITITTSNQV